MAEPAETTPEAPEPTEAPEAASPLSINAILAGAEKADLEQEPANDTSEDAPAANDNEKPEGDKQPEPEQISAETLFTPEALATPEGVLRGREVLLRAKAHLEDRHHRLDRFDTRIKRQAKELRAEQARIEPVRAQAKLFIDEVRSLRAESGLSAKERFAKMARLVGEDPHEFYESLSVGLATDGKQPPKSREIVALEKKLQDIEAERQREREQLVEERRRAEEHHVRSRVAQITEQIAAECANAVTYPVLADRIANGSVDPSDAAQWVVDYLTNHLEQTGERLDRSAAISMLESRLAKAVGGQASRAPQGESRSGSRLNRPGSPASTAGKRAVSVTPTLADRSTGVVRRKPMTTEERLDELARDPQALADLGLGRLL